MDPKTILIMVSVFLLVMMILPFLLSFFINKKIIFILARHMPLIGVFNSMVGVCLIGIFTSLVLISAMNGKLIFDATLFGEAWIEFVFLSLLTLIMIFTLSVQIKWYSIKGDIKIIIRKG